MGDIESWGNPIDAGFASAALELCESSENPDSLVVEVYKNQFISDKVGDPRNNDIAVNYAKAADPIIANHIEKTGCGIPSESARVEIPHTDFKFNEVDKTPKESRRYLTPNGFVDEETAGRIYMDQQHVNMCAFANTLCEVLCITRHLLDVPKCADSKTIVENAMWIKPDCRMYFSKPDKYVLDYMAERIISIFGMNHERGMKLYTNAKSFRGFISEIISTSAEEEKLRKDRMENEYKMSAWGFDPENLDKDPTEVDAVNKKERVLGCVGSKPVVASIHENTKPTSSGQKKVVDESKGLSTMSMPTAAESTKDTNNTRLTGAIASIKSSILPDVSVKKVTISITYEM